MNQVVRDTDWDRGEQWSQWDIVENHRSNSGDYTDFLTKVIYKRLGGQWSPAKSGRPSFRVRRGRYCSPTLIFELFQLESYSFDFPPPPYRYFVCRKHQGLIFIFGAGLTGKEKPWGLS